MFKIGDWTRLSFYWTDEPENLIKLSRLSLQCLRENIIMKNPLAIRNAP